MAIANGTCVSWVRPWDNRGKCHMDEKRIQPVSSKVRHFSTFFAHSPVWHILASPGYAPGTIAVNVTWMERGFIRFNACKTLRCIPIYLQPFLRYMSMSMSIMNLYSAES